MPRLSGAELKVLLYIIRRTFGFKRSSDDISLSQMVKGIKKKNGEILDQGTGLSKASVARALNSLEQKKVILRQRRFSGKNGDEATTYALNIVNPTPVSQKETPPVSKRDTPVSHQRDTQQTVLQQTVKQQQQKANKNITESGGDDARKDIAAALINKGIAENVAYQLVTRYSRQQIEDNLDWFEWKLANDPNSIKTNPAGLLRRAIEKNYAAEGHHKGFQTRRQKEAIAAAQKQRQAAQQKLIEARNRESEALLQQKKRASVKQLELLRGRYHTKQQDLKLWHQVLHRLRRELTQATFNTYLAQTELLSLRDGKALIVVPNRFVKKRIENDLAHLVQSTLMPLLDGQKCVIQCQTLDELTDE
jgi:hypothetical protein